MSIQVELTELADAMAAYPFGYLITTGDDGRAHVVAVAPHVDGRHLVVADPGRRTAANIASRPAVTLLWPPPDPSGFTLIVDGEASRGEGTVADMPDASGAVDAVTIVPGRAVLHRPAPGLGSDSVTNRAITDAPGLAAGGATNHPGADILAPAAPTVSKQPPSAESAPACQSDCVEVNLGGG